MEVLTRETCLVCDGTGKNNLSREEAHSIATTNQGGIFPLAIKISRIMECGNCNEGYIEEWISLNELLSKGI